MSFEVALGFLVVPHSPQPPTIKILGFHFMNRLQILPFNVTGT